jgi:hypothetical protein
MYADVSLFGNGKIGVNCGELSLFVDCLLNKMVDQEEYDFLEAKMYVQVEPDDRRVQFVITDELKDDQRLKAACEKAAFLHFEQKLELTARDCWLENMKRRRVERKVKKEVPPARRGRWSA